MKLRDDIGLIDQGMALEVAPPTDKWVVAPQGHFRRAGRYDVVGFQCVPRTGRDGFHGVGWGNGWMSVPPATAPAFGERHEMGPVGSFPPRNFGGRTAVMVRSVPH